MNQPLRIVIAGGGTAGWMAANLLAHRFAAIPIDITLIESKDIGTIGVGEGSTPTLKRFFQTLDIAEHQWMPACHATYKVNIKFNGWSGDDNVSYSHPFFSQLDVHSERSFYVNALTRRLGLDVETTPDRFFMGGYLAKKNLAPIPSHNFPFAIEYGYHFDSHKLSEFLKQHAKRLGVEHIEGNIASVGTSVSGAISHLTCKDGQVLKGDFFIDCTGFSSLLLQKTLNVPFTSFNNNLFNDSAVVLATPAIDHMPVETESSTMSNGWCWQIPLRNRTGNGYVYSQQYQDKDKAEYELRNKLNLLDSDVEARHLTMRVGQCEQHWVKNCLAVGLSQGFIEPLEATALHLVQITIEQFATYYAKGNYTEKYQQHFNSDMTERFERIRDYIVCHYKLNGRTDSQYWTDNRENMQLSESLLSLLDVWYRKGDIVQEIKRQDIGKHFSAASWHCLLAGYRVFPQIAQHQPASLEEQGDLFEENKLSTFFNRCSLNFEKQKTLFTSAV